MTVGIPSDRVVITLAGAPTGKGRPRFRRATGHTYTPEKTRAYEITLRNEAQHVMGKRPLLMGALQVDVVAIFPIPASWPRKRRAAALRAPLYVTKKPDSDNLLKVMDALNGVVWGDDAQAAAGQYIKVYGEKPSYTVIVQPADPAFALRLLSAMTVGQEQDIDIFA